jgi:hypothetical protein
MGGYSSGDPPHVSVEVGCGGMEFGSRLQVLSRLQFGKVKQQEIEICGAFVGL